MAGEWANRGETENAVPLSDTSEGAPSYDSALDASDTDGEGRGVSLLRREGKEELMVKERVSAGLAKESDCARSSNVFWH